jgi:hypothetical protein
MYHYFFDLVILLLNLHLVLSLLLGHFLRVLLNALSLGLWRTFLLGLVVVCGALALVVGCWGRGRRWWRTGSIVFVVKLIFAFRIIFSVWVLVFGRFLLFFFVVIISGALALAS